MTRKLLITSAAALLAGTVLAAGQEGQRNPGGAQPGAAQEHQAPAAKPQEAPGAKPQGQRQQGSPAQPRAQERSQNQGQRPSTTGQGQREEGQAPTQRREGQDNKNQDNKKGPDRAQGPNERREQGQNQRDQDRREGREDRRDRTQGQNDRDRNRRDEGRQDRDDRQQGQNDRRQGQDNRNNDRDRTQGQGPGRPGASVTFTTEQRTRIRETVLTGGSANRVTSINFSIGVGVAVPRSVHLVAVPSVIVEYHPAWRGFLYFVYEDEIIIVDPRSHHIVAVIDV